MPRSTKLSTKQKVLLGAGIYFGITILLLLVAGSQGKNEEFKPQNEFKLDNWIPIHLGPRTCRSTRPCSTCCWPAA